MDIIIILIITTIIILIMDIIILITITISIIIRRSGLLGTSLWSFQDTQCLRLSSLHNLEGDSPDIINIKVLIILAIVDHHCHQCFHRSCHFQHLPHHHRCHFQRGVKVLDWVDFLLLLPDHRLQTRNQVKIIRMLIMMMIKAIIMIIMTITTIMTLMIMTILCRPASYGSWQAVIASKVEGPSKEPGPFLYSGGKPFYEDYDDEYGWWWWW